MHPQAVASGRVPCREFFSCDWVVNDHLQPVYPNFRLKSITHMWMKISLFRLISAGLCITFGKAVDVLCKHVSNVIHTMA